jgi:hypothetical protein
LEFDPDSISAETLGVNEERWRACIKMLVDNGYIEGVTIKTYVCEKIGTPDVTSAKITLKGLEYLQENSMMKKMYRTAKGIKETVPGL